MTGTERAVSYCNDILSGKIDACRWVKLACERFQKDLDRQGTEEFPYIFDLEKANRIVRFMERLPHVKGKWSAANQNLILQPWQCFIECQLFGWVHKDTGFRRFRKSYECIPRKNGKSIRVGARGLYLFCADNESGAEVYSGATSEKQAFEVYKPAWMMVAKTPALKERFSIDQAGNPKNPGAMFMMDDMSKFETIIGKPGDGASPHAALVDEYHEHDSDDLIDTMETGMGAREQPMLCIITTAGSNLAGPCYAYQQDIVKILEGTVIDETVFGIIYGLDEGDAWDDPKNLIKANPNYNISVFGEFLLAQLNQARRSASKQNTFRTKHLNEWVGAKTAWMNMVSWQKQLAHVKMEDFVKYPCRIAVDLASKIDIAAVDVTFDVDGDYYSFKKFFCPEETAEDNDTYKEYVTAGCLELTPGSMIDQEAIEDYLDEIRQKFNVIDLAFDEWQADYMMTRLMKKGFEVVKFPFNTKAVSPPMKQIEALVLSGKYWHDGNPLMTWMVSNVTAFLDKRDNIFPNKARPSDKKCKIDGVAVAIMCMGRWMSEDKPKKEYQMFFA